MLVPADERSWCGVEITKGGVLGGLGIVILILLAVVLPLQFHGLNGSAQHGVKSSAGAALAGFHHGGAAEVAADGWRRVDAARTAAPAVQARALVP